VNDVTEDYYTQLKMSLQDLGFWSKYHWCEKKTYIVYCQWDTYWLMAYVGSEHIFYIACLVVTSRANRNGKPVTLKLTSVSQLSTMVTTEQTMAQCS